MNAAAAKKIEPHITTTSRSRVWWLINMRGYQVKMEVEEPRESALGGIKYVRRWILGRLPASFPAAVSTEGE